MTNNLPETKHPHDVSGKTPETCTTGKGSTALARILTTSAHFLKVGARPKVTYASKPQAPTDPSAETATTP